MANTLDESGAVLEDSGSTLADNVIPLRPAPDATGEAPKRKPRAKRTMAPTLAAVVEQGAQAAAEADAAVSHAVDAGVQAVGAVGNLGKWIVFGLIAWVVFSATGDKE